MPMSEIAQPMIVVSFAPSALLERAPIGRPQVKAASQIGRTCTASGVMPGCSAPSKKSSARHSTIVASTSSGVPRRN